MFERCDATDLKRDRQIDVFGAIFDFAQLNDAAIGIDEKRRTPQSASLRLWFALLMHRQKVHVDHHRAVRHASDDQIVATLSAKPHTDEKCVLALNNGRSYVKELDQLLQRDDVAHLSPTPTRFSDDDDDDDDYKNYLPAIPERD